MPKTTEQTARRRTVDQELGLQGSREPSLSKNTWVVVSSYRSSSGTDLQALPEVKPLTGFKTKESLGAEKPAA